MSDTFDPQPSDSPWAQLQSLRAAGVPRVEWAPRLLAAGIDPESVAVLVNAADGPNPQELPTPSFAPPVHPLATSLAISEIGLSGSPTAVGAYWLTFGVAALLMLGLLHALAALDVTPIPEPALTVLDPTIGFVAAVAIGSGGWRVIQSLRIRRRGSPPS